MTAVRIENEIRYAELETGVFIAPDGGVLLRKQGVADRVGFTVRELRRMGGAIFTHNHPGGGSFSPHDLARAGESGVAELRVVTPVFRHIMLLPPIETGPFWQTMLETEQNQIAVRLIDQVRIGVVHPKDYGLEVLHLAWVSIAAKMGFTYQRSKS